MTRSLAHRGPDAAGVIRPEGEGFGLGSRRLAILDLTAAGSQPMIDSEGRYWITYNGEVYNFRELRSELESLGRVFRSGTDTEVVLAAYAVWGPRCLDRFNGMFAFAIWDRVSRSLFAARDRLGIKPFYWARHGASLLFASEIKGILASGLIRAEADPEITHNPWHYPSAPRTGFVGIQKLPGGHFLTWNSGRVDVRRWWSVTASEDDPGWSEAAEELGGLVEDAVRLQMISDVPIGAMLSGGLDSSLIVALMQQLSTSPVHTYSIQFDRSDQRREVTGEDGQHARDLARQLGCVHHELELSSDIVTLLPKLVWHLDEPIADPAAINTYLIAQAARGDGIRVLLNGMGADEVFGGYRKYKACALADTYQAALPLPARRTLERILDRLPVAGGNSGFRRIRWLKRFLSFASLPRTERFLLSDLSLSPDDYRHIYADAEDFPYETLAEVRERRKAMQGASGDYLARMCLSDTTIYLQDHNLAYTDRAAMAAGVEARPPLVDHRIVELAFRLSSAYRIRGANQKAILRRAASRWLPRAILRRPKSPFSAPVRSWIRGDLREMVDDMLSPSALRSRGIYHPAAVRQLIDEDRQGRADRSQQIWTLLSREVWFRTYIDSTARPAFAEAPVEIDSRWRRTTSPSATASRPVQIQSGPSKRKRLLAIVQLPPPIHGVSVMNQAVVDSVSLARVCEVEVLPLRFARSVSDLGRVTFRKGFLAAGLAMRLIAMCVRRRPDLAYFTLVPVGQAFYRDLALVLVLRLFRVRTIFHLHGVGVREAGRGPFNKRLYRWVFNERTVIHLSPRLYPDIEAFVPRERCRFLANGVPDGGRTLGLPHLRSDEASPRVLFVSNMSVLKGPLLLLRALIALRARDVPFEAQFVGPWVESRCQIQFERLVRDHGLTGSVRHLGPKYGPERDAILASADLVVFPTVYPCEAFPLVVLEAMSFALPVIATRWAAIPDMVEDGVTGFLIDPKDEQALASRIELLLRQPELRRRMGEAGRRRYLERFTMERFDKDLTAILDDELGQPRSTGSAGERSLDVPASLSGAAQISSDTLDRGARR